MSDPLRILLIAYRFPPQGGGGVQRPAKLVKYWTRRGVPVAVLTSTGESVRVKDQTLLHDIPDSMTRVAVPDPSFDSRLRALRARFQHPLVRRAIQALLALNFHLSVPDLRSGWKGPALRAGDELIASFKPNVIVVTGPPWTPLLVADRLARRHGLPLVLDYRDPWTQSYLEIKNGWLPSLLNPGLERRIVGRATGVIGAHRAILGRLRKWMGPEGRWMWIPNGSDEEDIEQGRIAGVPQPIVKGRFVLGYAGGFFRWRAPHALLRVIESLQREGRISADTFQFRMAGSVEPALSEVAEDSPVRSLIEVNGYLRHHDAIAFLDQNTVNLVMEADFGNRTYTTPGKFYELLSIGRPILLLTAPGPTSHLAQRVGGCWIARPNDEAEIRKALLAMFSHWESGAALPQPDQRRIKFYERQKQADRAIQFLSSLTNRPLPENRAASSPLKKSPAR